MGSVWPGNVQKTGVSPGRQSGSSIVAAEAERSSVEERPAHGPNPVSVPFKGPASAAAWAQGLIRPERDWPALFEWSVDTQKAKSPNPKVEEGDRHRPGDDAPTD